MGNSTNSFDSNFKNNWVQLQRTNLSNMDRNLWARKNNPSIQIQQYPLNVTSKQQLQEQKRINTLRQNHPQLVSSVHFVDQTEEEFCASTYKGKIYIQRIPLTLQTITDIPFPDALHLYSQALQGFHTICNQTIGYFPISQQHIGINCSSVCKVWMNNCYNRNYPSRNQRISQGRMVKNIIDTIQSNADLASLQGRPSPGQYIYSKAQSPSDVKFGQAINLLRNYAKQYFNGVIPQKVDCVQKVGGSSQLSKNWQGGNSYIPQTIKSPHILNQNARVVNPTIQTNYTTFKRQEPLQRTVPIQTHQHVSTYKPVVNSTVTTPNFKSLSVGSRVTPNTQTVYQKPVSFEKPVVQQSVVTPVLTYKSPASSQATLTKFENRPIPQVVYRKDNVGVAVNQTRRSQFIRNVPVRTSNVNLVNTAISSVPVTTNIINNRVEQVTSQKNIMVKPLAQSVHRVVQAPNNLVKQSQIIFRQSPHTTVIPQKVSTPKNAINFVRSSNVQTVPTMVQSVTVPIQPSGLRVQSSQVFRIPPPPATNNIVNTTTVVGEVVNNTTTLNNNQLEQVNSKIVFLGKTVPAQTTVNQTQQQTTVSANTTQQNQQVNEQLTQQLNHQTVTQQTVHQQQSPSQPVDYSTMYYAFTNKLYDKQESNKKQAQPLSFNQTSKLTSNNFVNNTFNNFTSNNYTQTYKSSAQNYKSTSQNYSQSFGFNNRPTLQSRQDYSSPTKDNKYNVSLDDGMSSAAFLNQLKNMKFSSSGVKQENNYDFISSYQPQNNYTSAINNFSIDTYEHIKPMTLDYSQNAQRTYKVDYQNYNTTLTDGRHHDQDIHVVGQRINMVPLNTANGLNLNDQRQYRMSYELEQGQTPSGNLHYQAEVVKVQNNGGTYQQTYYNQQTIFDKYASYYNTQDHHHAQPLGENIQTQYSIHNLQDSHHQVHSHTHSPAHEPEEYKVQYDAQILADLERLKGSN